MVLSVEQKFALSVDATAEVFPQDFLVLCCINIIVFDRDSVRLYICIGSALISSISTALLESARSQYLLSVSV